MTALLAPIPFDPEVDRLQRVLKDVRFLLERGCWQAALATARAALIRDARTPAMSPQPQETTDA
jgi:hypothetical protein